MNKKRIISTIKGHLESLKEEGFTHLPLTRQGKKKIKRPVKAVATGRVAKREQLLSLKEATDSCKKCSALVKNRTQVVFGAGHANAELMFVGEAPGMEEDIQGVPFVGKAGQLLTKMIESIGLTRRQVFIANVLKCRPPHNRNPLPQEIIQCEPYLLQQIDIIQPKLICALGTFAARTLLKTDRPISQLRGVFHNYHNVQLLPTFHPAYLLRNVSEKRKAWEDMKMIKKALSR